MISLSTPILADTVARRLAAFTGGSIRIFAGTRPASANAAETGTLLGIATPAAVPGAGLPLYAFDGGFGISPADDVGFTALASGTAAWFRLVAPGDSGGDTSTESRIDGSIGTFAAPGDMAWMNTAIAAGNRYSLDTFNYFIHPIGPTP